MSNHADLSEIHNALKAMEAKIAQNNKVLGWMLLLSAVGLVVAMIDLAILVLK